MQGKKVLVVGCGKVGGRVAKALASDFQVYGLRRRPQTAQEGIHYIAANVCDEAALAEALTRHLPDGADYLLYCLTPSERSEQAYRDTYVCGLENVLKQVANAMRLRRVIFVSSSSVYHQNNDGWINEQSLCQPKSYAGRLILEAETLLEQSGVPSSIVRFSGIYGGTRRQLIKQVLESADTNTPILSHTLRRSNRIHEDDCVGFLEHLIHQADLGVELESHYLATDNEPVDLNTVISWLAEQLGLALSQELTEQASRRSGNKKCSNKRMLESGYQLRYPSYREGYRAMLESSGLC